MINVAAEPFRMMASGNCEKLNRELIACFVAYALKEPYLLVYLTFRKNGGNLGSESK